MRTTTGLVVSAVGAVLLFAVNIPLPWLSLKIVGLVILCTGLVGLRIPQRAGGWLRRNQDLVMETIDPVAGTEDAPRVPLDTLLDPDTGLGRPAAHGEAGQG
jgi:hypothetical protein